MATSTQAILTIGKNEYGLPLVKGTEGQVGVDVTRLQKTAGVTTLDNGFANTALCQSVITYVDGEKGILRYRGYDILDLVENCTFIEVAYLMVLGALPTQGELKRFSSYLNQHSMIHEDMHHFFTGFPADSHPMAILASMVTSL